MLRLLGAHLPAASPERRETVAGECLGCQTQFAIDVRLPLPATRARTAGPTCSPARTSRVRNHSASCHSTRRGSGGRNDDLAFHRGGILRELIELAEHDADAELVDALRTPRSMSRRQRPTDESDPRANWGDGGTASAPAETTNP